MHLLGLVGKEVGAGNQQSRSPGCHYKACNSVRNLRVGRSGRLVGIGAATPTALIKRANLLVPRMCHALLVPRRALSACRTEDRDWSWDNRLSRNWRCSSKAAFFPF